MSDEHILRLIANSFSLKERVFEKYEILIHQLENARSFWSECYRVILKPKTNEIIEEIPNRVFIKIPKISTTNSTLDQDNDEENEKLLKKMCEREYAFNRDFRHVQFNEFKIPKNFYVEDYEFDKGGIVFEDLSGITYTIDYIPGFTEEQLLKLLNSLAGFHHTTLSMTDRIKWENYKNDLYDGDYMEMMFNDTSDIENLRPELFKGKINKVKWIFSRDSVERSLKIDKAIGMPIVLVHNDLNASNILWNVQSNEIEAIIDFQHLAKGSIATDLCRILTLGLSVENRRNNTEKYLKFYYDALSKFRNAPFTFENLKTAYQMQFPLANATTLFGMYYYYKMYKEDTITINGEREMAAEEILRRALAIIEEIENMEH
ncbi:unnamed protein product [Caenorhabditis bovis]|uniref:CHK kinase-like domain-containing protein n=1 Tax=Caenorhabditis bovis TaxID=2654633 RepID=A0A8S1ENK7_9PELO|nr:unnamed protein product [Caenorhabditis bovis]